MVNSIHLLGIFPVYPSRGSDRLSVTVSATPANSKITVRDKSASSASAIKKLGKWSAIMEKISEPSSRPIINVKEVKSRFSQQICHPTISTTTTTNKQLQNNRLSSIPQSSFHLENNKPVRNNRLHANNQRNKLEKVGGPTTVASRHHLLIDHSDQDGYSVQSSTESESSLQDQSSGPSSTTTVSRMKKASLSRNRQPSDASSVSDISSTRNVSRQRRQPVTMTNGASKLALKSTSNITLSTNPNMTMTTTRMVGKKQSNNNSTSVPALNNHGISRNVTSRLHDSAKHSFRDRNNRMGPDGKLGTESTSDGRSSHNQTQSNIISSQHHHHHQNGGSNNIGSSVKSSQPLVSSAPVSSSISADGPNHHSSNNNNNNNAPSSPCNNNQAALTLENVRLKEQLNLQFELNADLKSKLDEANTNVNNTKIVMEADLKLLSQKFLAMVMVAQKFNEQRSVIEEKLRQEKNLAQQRENQLVSERVEEIQNLRVEFERERECIQEELLVMRKTDESQAEKLKELGVELEKKEQLLRTKTQEHEEESEELKRKHNEELDAIKDRYKHEAQEELIRSQVLKRTLSSPQPTNATNDVLQKEINSLHVVIDMRNQEIRSLRQELLTQKSFLEDLSSCKEQNKGLLAKVEDLNAQLVKSRQDKHDMQEKYHAAENAAGQSAHQLNQLQLENEQLKWRLAAIRTDERVSEIMSKSAVQLGCDAHINLDYETAMSSLLDPKVPNGCVK